MTLISLPSSTTDRYMFRIIITNFIKSFDCQSKSYLSRCSFEDHETISLKLPVEASLVFSCSDPLCGVLFAENRIAFDRCSC